MTTFEQNEKASFPLKNTVALLIATVFLSFLLIESRRLAKDYHTWSMWLLTAMIASVLLAAASTFIRRHSRTHNEKV
jgi:hypothetical protein